MTEKTRSKASKEITRQQTRQGKKSFLKSVCMQELHTVSSTMNEIEGSNGINPPSIMQVCCASLKLKAFLCFYTAVKYARVQSDVYCKCNGEEAA